MTTRHPLYLAVVIAGLVAALTFTVAYARAFDRRNEAARYILFFVGLVDFLYIRRLYVGMMHPRLIDWISWSFAIGFLVALVWQLSMFVRAQRRGGRQRLE